MQYPYWALTCELDVTLAKRFMTDCAIPSYVGMIYLVTKAANCVAELMLRIVDDVVYACDVVHPSFTVLNNRGQLNFCATRYSEDPNTFIARTREVMDQVKNAPESSLESTGQDVLYLSCLPWVHFTSVSHPMSFSPPDAIPRIVWGRFEPRDNRTLLAVSLQAHHGLADGAHVSEFMQALSSLCANPETGFAGFART
jgi:chloramphenicol O-acetyltransferase type A